VKPAPFEYLPARSLADAVSALGDRAGDARILAGGQSLVPLMCMRRVRPAALVDINGIGALDYARVHDGRVEIGALCRQRRVEEDGTLPPMLREAIRFVGHPQVRSRGTVVGSLCHADPSGELPVVLLALGGSVKAVGPRGSRDIPAVELFQAPFRTSLAPDEVAVEARLPAARGGAEAFCEFAEHEGEFALVAVAVALGFDAGGRCEEVRAAAGGVGPTPLEVRGSLADLLGAGELSDSLLRQVSARVAADVRPAGDDRASEVDRRELAGLLAARAVARAWSRRQAVAA
jgi:aerobic carbon-monoxide dehydrogenase medium subunit